jgi:hypothetical protein
MNRTSEATERVRAANWLCLAPEVSEALGGLKWGRPEDNPVLRAIEYPDGQTFMLAAALASFVEGFQTQGPLIHLGLLLHLLRLLRHGSAPGGVHDFTPLTKAWNQAGKPSRNAGALAAVLCQGVPAVPDPPSLGVLLEVLTRGIEAAGPSTPSLLPLGLAEFEQHLARDLTLDHDALVHWFRYGWGPLAGQGADLARRLLLERPRLVEGLLEDLARYDRLAGAQPLVEQMVSALSLPPRRLTDRQLPLGGFSDITTRGHPEHLLPFQFALEEIEFIRRHAENELLYYRREEPQRPLREELVVLLDQGVRTWGVVRLALVAAVFALVRLSACRQRARQSGLLLALTSEEGAAFDPLLEALDSAKVSSLADRLGQSDLSPHPAQALEAVLEHPDESGDSSRSPRDVILLTHPRNLAEPELIAAARRVRPGTRLFSLTIGVAAAHPRDATEGQAELSELRGGVPVSLLRFRVDLDPPRPAATQPRPLAAPPRVVRPPWRGDIEPVPFPFVFGGSTQGSDGCRFVFDAGGEYLLLASHCCGSLLQLTRIPDGRTEVLPRPVWQGELLSSIQTLLGVAGGFVVAGVVSGWLVAAHYDLRERTVQVYCFPTGVFGGRCWRYLRKRHVLLLVQPDQIQGVHLSTGKFLQLQEVAALGTIPWDPDEPGVQLRIHTRDDSLDLILPFQEGSEPPGWPVGMTPAGNSGSWREPKLHFRPREGSLHLDDVVPGWLSFQPRQDGRPLLFDRWLLRADCQRDILAASFQQPNGSFLYLFQGPDGQTLTSFPLRDAQSQFRLSPDGRWLAVQKKPPRVEVYEVPDARVPRCLTLSGRFHHDVSVTLGPLGLALIIAQTTHLIHWAEGRLVFFRDRGVPADFLRESLGPDPVQARLGAMPAFLRYDRKRFRAAGWSHLIAVVDLFGQVFLFERSGDLVCSFFAFQQQCAAWAPDGTTAGSATLLGQDPTPGGAERIGRLLLEAWARGRETN